MTELKTQQHIRFAKIEQANAWIVVAVLYERQGDQLVALSEPKIVKVIPKQLKMLSGSVASGKLYLAPPKVSEQKLAGTVSPYASSLFVFSNTDLDITQAARPPTRA